MIICDKLSEIIIKRFCFEKCCKVLYHSNINLLYVVVFTYFYWRSNPSLVTCLEQIWSKN